MRADRVEVGWDEGKESWLVEIISGEEVIRRHRKLAKDANDAALRLMARQALIDEGFDPQLADGPPSRSDGKISWSV
jgi:hypothetical protein